MARQKEFESPTFRLGVQPVGCKNGSNCYW